MNNKCPLCPLASSLSLRSCRASLPSLSRQQSARKLKTQLRTHRSAWSDEPGAAKDVKKKNVDYFWKQLRDMCYRKVKGNGADISIREIFRHFDSDKDGDGEHGIDKQEFVDAVKRMMLGTSSRGIISTEEAVALFERIDTDKSGTIDYRETAACLSLPGWDNSRLKSPHLGL